MEKPSERGQRQGKEENKKEQNQTGSFTLPLWTGRVGWGVLTFEMCTHARLQKPEKRSYFKDERGLKVGCF